MAAVVHRDLSLGTRRVTLGLSKNPDAVCIRICNPKNVLLGNAQINLAFHSLIRTFAHDLQNVD